MTKKERTNIVPGNDLAARIILTDPVRYAGLPLIWARLWVSRQGAPAEEGGVMQRKLVKHG